MKFHTEDTLLLVIDIQEKLAHAMHETQALLDNLKKIIQGAHILDIPIVMTEQVNLGPTIPEIAELAGNNDVITKRSFSCCGEEEFIEELTHVNRSQILVTGIECHICVYQTAVDLVQSNYSVQVVADCVSSRTAANRSIGLDRMQSEGVKITSTEMALFELLKVAEGDRIRQISRLVK